MLQNKQCKTAHQETLDTAKHKVLRVIPSNVVSKPRLLIFLAQKTKSLAWTVLSSAFDARYRHVGATSLGSNSEKDFLHRNDERALRF